MCDVSCTLLLVYSIERCRRRRREWACDTSNEFSLCENERYWKCCGSDQNRVAYLSAEHGFRRAEAYASRPAGDKWIGVRHWSRCDRCRRLYWFISSVQLLQKLASSVLRFGGRCNRSAEYSPLAIAFIWNDAARSLATECTVQRRTPNIWMKRTSSWWLLDFLCVFSQLFSSIGEFNLYISKYKIKHNIECKREAFDTRSAVYSTCSWATSTPAGPPNGILYSLSGCS